MESISSRIEKVTPSLTLAVTNQAKAMKARGEEVYGLAGGEPEVDTPDFIKAAAIQACRKAAPNTPRPAASPNSAKPFPKNCCSTTA